MLALTMVRPIDHFNGFHTFYPVFASGRGTAPFRTVKDYENNLTRHRDFVALVDRAIARFRQGLASGVVQTKLTIRNVIEQLDTQLADGARGHRLTTARSALSPPRPGGGAGAAARRLCRSRSATASSPPTGGFATSSRTTICRTPATASACRTCAAATCSTAVWSQQNTTCR